VADKDDLEDTQAAMDADTKFLLEVQRRCTDADHEFEKRAEMRTDEIAALSEAIKILSDDDIKEAQQTTFGFLQSAKETRVQLRALEPLEKALSHLQAIAPHNADVIALVALAKADPFGKITQAIDKLIDKLKLQQVDEVKKRDYCVDALHENEVVNQRKSSDLSRLEAAIVDLTNHHMTLTSEVDTLKSEIMQLHIDMQRAAENRKGENLAYQKSVSDQQRTQEALAAAYTRLEKFYAPKSALLQEHKKPADAYFAGGAPEMGSYKGNSGTKGVMGLMKKLQGEARILEDDTVNDEQNAQTAYEIMISDTNASVRQKNRLITDKAGELARVDKEKQQKSIDREQVLADLDGLSNEKADLLAECSFLLKNFDLRQESRAAEIDALGEVKGILAGMKA